MTTVNKTLLVQHLCQLLGPGTPEDAIARAVDRAVTQVDAADSRQVTILLSDLRGFTSMSEKYSARQMVEALNRYFRCMSEIILRYGGTIDKFMGDAIMVLFGAPISREDALTSALACAIEMQGAMAAINEDNKGHGIEALYMGIGINTGEVIAGHLGSELHSEYTVIGDQVNLASRIEAHSLRGQILLSENTYQLSRDIVEIGDVNDIKVKGKKGSVRMYELLAVHQPRHLKAPNREIRNSPRVEVDMPLTFQCLSGKLVLPQTHIGRIIDMSYGGICFVSPVALETLDDIKISFSLTLLDAPMTDIYAKVLRVAPASTGHECRVEFTAIDAATTASLKEFVNSIVELNRL